MLILIIEDSDLQRKLLGGFFSKKNIDYIEADNAARGLALIEERRPDCVFLDLLMPDMNGIHALETMKERGFTMPVIVLSADIQDTTRARCYELGVRDFLNKPYKGDQIMAALEKIFPDSFN